jgi:hypothetical protein
MREDAARRGVPALDERIVKECCLGRGVEVPDMAVLKDFFRFQACAMGAARSRRNLPTSPSSALQSGSLAGHWDRDWQNREERSVQRELATDS